MSENVEMYLVSLARIAEEMQDETVPIPALAERLNILPVSTNQMIRKLEETGLVQYIPYKGVQLTEAGQTIASQIRRQHQLWRAFLINHLQFQEEAAESLACRLEHVLSDEEIENLAAFLEDPGDLSSAKGSYTAPVGEEKGWEYPLAQLTVNQSGIVIGTTTDQASNSFLFATGIHPGALITALARADSGDILVRVHDRGQVHLSTTLAAQIWVRKV